MSKEYSRLANWILALLAVVVLAPWGATASDHSTPASAARWSREELAILSTLRLRELGAVPVDASNAVERNPAAIALGKKLFNDPRFSRNGQVACATCHDPGKQLQDGLPVSKGVGIGGRRAMPIVGVGHSPWLFWDGRKDSVWSQALGPLEDAVEHGGNRSAYAHLLNQHYRKDYERLFGPMPDLTQVPMNAGPNGAPVEKAAWDALDPQRRQSVSRVFANMGKAIAAYEKSLAHGESRFDRFAEAALRGRAESSKAMSDAEKNGLRLFIGKGQCATCHNGPLFSDRQFHNTAVPQRDLSTPDHGRMAAIAKVVADEFNCLGPFSDAKPEQCAELRFIVGADKSLDGAFKTPSLRGVALRPPYMHAGQFATLRDAVAHYVKAPPAQVGHTELAHGPAGHTERQPIRLTDQEIDEVVAFLGTLSGPIIDPTER